MASGGGAWSIRAPDLNEAFCLNATSETVNRPEGEWSLSSRMFS